MLQPARRALRLARLRCRQWFAVDQANETVDCGVDAAVEVAGAKLRSQVLIDDAARREIGHGPLQTLADLKAHAMVVERDDQDRAIVDALATELPRIGKANAEGIDVLRLGGRHDHDRDLAAFAGLEGRQSLADRALLLHGQRTGEIGDPRHRRQRDLRQRRRQRRKQCQHEAGSDCRERPAPGAHDRDQLLGLGAGALLKSTVGALLIAASFSTEKFGFTL